MSWLRQIIEITWMGLATLPQRLGSALVIVIGIAGVVSVLIAILAMGEGFQTIITKTGRVDEVIVLRKGANSELNSVIRREDAVLITQGPGILKNNEGKPIASAEAIVVANLLKKSTNTDMNIEIRGVGPQVWDLRPNAHVFDGRRFDLGKRELVVGKGARSEFAGLVTGATVRLGQQDWKVVGTFTSGDAYESELWGDVEVVQSTYQSDGYQSVTLKLTNADTYEELKTALSTDLRLSVDVERTSDYYATQSEDLTRLIRILGVSVASIMGIGAIFGALNTMFTAVSTRTREIATLRALGFPATVIVISVLLEATLLASLGGVIGAGTVWLIFDKYTVSTLGANFNQIVFAFKVSPQLIVDGLAWAIFMGLVGGLFPAVAAARIPITSALRNTT